MDRSLLPRTGRPTLVRPRLLDPLRSRWFSRVTVLVAPAGYGKTTLLTQAIDDNGSTPLGLDCWVPWGSVAGTGAWRGSSAASILGAALCEAVGVLPTPGNGGVRDVDEVAAAVSGAVWCRSPEHVALVLDDVQEVVPGSDAAALLSALVSALPANGHLVLAGRVPPPVPLARLEAEGRVIRLEVADLAFTDDELAAFAALRSVPAEQVAHSGGWPALAELSASARPERPGVSSRYVREEVLGPLEPVRRRQIAVLAHLGSFDDELAHAALDAVVDVDALTAGLPLVTTMPDGARALHPLWRSMLAGEVDPAELATARRRAGLALVSRREPDKAVPLLIEAGAWEELGTALLVLLGAAHAVAPRDVLAEWYDRLPPQEQAGPHGQVLAAVRSVELDPDHAWQQLEECADAFRAAGSASGEAACLAQLARLAWWSDEIEPLARVGVRMASLAEAGCEDAVALTCLGRALILDLQNDLGEMLVELDRIPAGTLNQAWQGVVSVLRSIAFLQLGDPDRALAAAEDALARAGDLHGPLAEAARVQALWFAGRTAEALDAVPALLERLEVIGHRGHIAVGAAQCSVAFSLVGDRERAAAYLAQARARATAPGGALIDTNLSIADVAVAVANGDEASARRTLVACLDRNPLRQGLSAGAHLRNLALIYVLIPETRPQWEQEELGPAFLAARDLASAVAAVRDDRRLPEDTPPLPHIGVVQAHLPLRWIAELAVGAIAVGRADGWRLLEDTWPASRPAVLALADNREPGERLRGVAREVLRRLPVPPTARYHLRLLGPTQLRRDGSLVDVPEWRRERVRALLAYLVMHRAVSREQLAEALWPDRDPDAQSRNLRVTLTYLLRVLEPERGPRDVSFFVRQHGGSLSLHPGEWLQVDVWELEALCQQAAAADQRREPSATIDLGFRAAGMWSNEPGDLATEPWAVAPIETWRRQFTTTVTRAGELLLAHGDHDQALTLAERALDADPWLERAHRLVIAAHHANHDDLAARRAAARYRNAVHELGVDVDEATRMAEHLLATVAAHPHHRDR